MNPDLSQVKIIHLPHHFEENGDLIVMEQHNNVPFEIQRVFVVRAPKGSIRGQHSHIKCTQLLTCPNGIIDVQCDDGKNKSYFILNQSADRDNEERSLNKRLIIISAMISYCLLIYVVIDLGR